MDLDGRKIDQEYFQHITRTNIKLSLTKRYCILHSPTPPLELHLDSTYSTSSPHPVHIHSSWTSFTPHLLHLNSTWTPHKLHINSILHLKNSHMESTWSLCGVHMEFKWSMWSPHGVHMELYKVQLEGLHTFFHKSNVVMWSEFKYRFLRTQKLLVIVIL